MLVADSSDVRTGASLKKRESSLFAPRLPQGSREGIVPGTERTLSLMLRDECSLQILTRPRVQFHKSSSIQSTGMFLPQEMWSLRTTYVNP